ncbi:MAG: ATP-binding domain-containing protein, partial [Lachnospiraceae bacterium]|nr:ATP-binding domain-containing protein [Lachnospiraceae bacterium]
NPQTGKIPSLERGNFEFRVGDIVMQTQKNRPECSNGDIGVITQIISSKEDKAITVSFPLTNTIYQYEDEEIDELVLAYASTIHKAQGSQADAVVTCLADYHTFMLKRNFLYTAVSRAKKELWIYGNRSAIEKAILTEDTYRRETSLKHFLIMISGRTPKEPEYKQMELPL